MTFNITDKQAVQLKADLSTLLPIVDTYLQLSTSKSMPINILMALGLSNDTIQELLLALKNILDTMYNGIDIK
ncbi:MAG: hypothetical protein M0P35_00505 [Bacteroidales bacterium]|jgi:hypothetical protein|nr:hypothetical protein [Bacteroidales bacterium]